MNVTTPIDVREAARDCVASMGPIFVAERWGEAARDPKEVARQSVEAALRRLLEGARGSDPGAGLLQAEYETMLGELGDEACDEQVVGGLVAPGDWTARGARELVELVHGYGRFFLRNAAALAAAMDVEDGERGY